MGQPTGAGTCSIVAATYGLGNYPIHCAENSRGAVMKRLKCLWLALRMPGDGLNEAEQQLREMRDYYRIDLDHRSNALFRLVHSSARIQIKGDYRVARGCLPWDGEPAEVSIRRMRDREDQ